MQIFSGKKRRRPNLSPGARLLLYFATLIFSALSVAETIAGYFPYAVEIGIYVAAACGLTVSIVYLHGDLKYGIRYSIQTVTAQNVLAGRVYADYRFRAILTTSAAFFINLLYAFINGIYALLHHSAWLGTLAAYYLLLSMMRFTAVWQERTYIKRAKDGKSKIEVGSEEEREEEGVQEREQNRHQQEWDVCRKAGLLLIAMTAVLGGAVMLLLHSQGGKNYSGFLIFAVAAYTFYKIIIAVINLIKVRSMRSPLLLAIRNIGYADALVSVLSLQTAMFAAFGEGEGINIQLMNGMTGGAVCVMILLIGICMTATAGREKQKLTENCRKF